MVLHLFLDLSAQKSKFFHDSMLIVPWTRLGPASFEGFEGFLGTRLGQH